MSLPFSSGWIQALVRALFQPDKDSLLLELSDQAVPVVVLESDRPEYRFIKRQFPFMGGTSQAAVAAELSAIGVKMMGARATQGVGGGLAVVEFVRNLNAVPVDLILGHLVGSTELAPGEIGSNPFTSTLDSRLTEEAVVAPSASQLFRCHSAIGVGGGVFPLHDSLAANAATERGYIAIVAPGGFLAVQGQAVNTGVAANFRIWERPMRAGRYFV